jgi:DNA invertase Pin-like site-specific DNA recombinase
MPHQAVIRISTDKQDGLSQQLRIQKYCETHNIELEKTWEETGSGALKWSESIWAEILSSQKGITILVSDFTRISRDGARTFQLKTLCEERDIKVFDISTGLYPFEDTTVLYVQGMLAELEREKIIMRSKAGHLARTKRNKGRGYGYDDNGDIFPEEYWVLIQICNARHEFHGDNWGIQRDIYPVSYNKIAERLNNCNIRTREGKLWTREWVYKLYNSAKCQNIIKAHGNTDKIRLFPHEFEEQISNKVYEHYEKLCPDIVMGAPLRKIADEVWDGVLIDIIEDFITDRDWFETQKETLESVVKA